MEVACWMKANVNIVKLHIWSDGSQITIIISNHNITCNGILVICKRVYKPILTNETPSRKIGLKILRQVTRICDLVEIMTMQPPQVEKLHLRAPHLHYRSVTPLIATMWPPQVIKMHFRVLDKQSEMWLEVKCDYTTFTKSQCNVWPPIGQISFHKS